MEILKALCLLCVSFCLIKTVKSDCCYGCILEWCHDCTQGTIFCGYGKCNPVGCDCDGGCREGPRGEDSCDRCEDRDRYDVSDREIPVGFNYYMQDWMAQLSDEKFITDLNLPGTHDTMSHYGDLVGAMTQSMRLHNQLISGIRALDIRLKLEDGVLKVVHGITDQNSDFDTVLYTTTTFLREHTQETIIMRVKDENLGAGGFLDAFQRTVSPYSKRVWSDSWIPQLKDVRGQVVILRDFREDNDVLGIGWENIASANRNHIMDIQDEYVVDTEWDIAQKFDHVRDHIKKACTTPNPTTGRKRFFINFLSGTGRVPLLPKPFAVANAVNGMTLRMLENGFSCYYKRMGVLYMDFPGIDVIQAIAESNEGVTFKKFGHSGKVENVAGKYSNVTSSIDIVKRIMFEADSDKDGRMSFDECFIYVANRYKMSGLEMHIPGKEIFKQGFLDMDLNDDGFIGIDEIDPPK